MLLKNDGVLPIDKGVRSIAVIGPLADDKDSPLGNWRGQGAANSAVSLLEGVKAAVSPGTRVIYAEGAKLVTGARDFATPSVFNTTDRSGFAAAVDAARQADVVLLAVGEDAYQTGEGRSQAQLGLAGLQDELVRAVTEANKNVVVVLMSGRPLTIGHVAERVPALLETWLLGSQAGHAIADVLFGDYNPSGKLPVSFPRAVGQEPLYYGHKSTGRPGPEPGVTWSHYTDVSNDPLYPFGFGLSYTTFTYSDLRLSAAALDQRGELKVSVTVTNSGRRAGSEVVQLYVRDMVGSVTRPVKELKGFERVELGPGRSSDVTFTIRPPIWRSTRRAAGGRRSQERSRCSSAATRATSRRRRSRWSLTEPPRLQQRRHASRDASASPTWCSRRCGAPSSLPSSAGRRSSPPP